MKTQLKELLFLHFLNDGVRTTVIVLLPFIAKDLSLSLTQVGFLGSSQPLLAALFALPSGYITAKFGGFKAIFTLLVIYSVGVLGTAFSTNEITLFGMYLFTAIGFSMFHPVGFTLTAQTSEQKNVGRFMGDFSATGEIGRVALPPLALFFATIAGWRITLIVASVIGFSVFFAFLLKFPKNHMSESEDTTKMTTRRQFVKDIYYLFKNKKAFCISLSAIFDTAASSPQQVFLPFLLLAKGTSAANLAVAMGCFFVGSLVGKSILGRWADKFGNIKIFIFSEFCMAVILITLTQTASFIWLLLFCGLLGAFTKGTSPVVQVMFTELSDKIHYHKIFAFSELIIAVAAVLSVNLLGNLADHTDISVVFFAGAILAICASIPIFIYSNIKTSGDSY